jgi:hypothetical protein
MLVNNGCSNTDSYSIVTPRAVYPLVYDRTATPAIHLTEGFSRDQVRIYVNGRRIFIGVVNTPDNGTSFTKAINYNPPDSKYDLKVIINDHTYVAHINTNNGAFILLRMRPDTTLDVSQCSVSPMYN